MERGNTKLPSGKSFCQGKKSRARGQGGTLNVRKKFPLDLQRKKN